MAEKRIFIAIDISDEARERAARHIAQLRQAAKDVRIGWEKPEKLHLTLKFLGNIDEQEINDIKNAVGEVAHRSPVFSAALSTSGLFPSLREPRVLWLGVTEGREQLVKIAIAIDSACDRIGIPKETRPYSPHLTIARIREPKKGREIAALHLGKGFSPVTFMVDHLTVYESRLGQHGSTYSIVSRHSLATWPRRCISRSRP